MTGETKYVRAAHVLVLVDGYAPLLRDELLARPEIGSMVEAELDATITLGDGGLSFLRSQLFPAIAAAYDRVSTPIIGTVAGDEWTVKFSGETSPPNVVLVRDGEQVVVPQFALLAPEATARTHAFQVIAKYYRLNGEPLMRWLELLSKRIPADEEIIVLLEEIQNTPIGKSDAIQKCLESGTLSINILAPSSEGYYRQLVGDVRNAATLEDYIGRVTVPFLRQLLAEGHQQPLSLAWLLCAHPSISQVVGQEWKGSNQYLASGIAWLIRNGDPISRTGAIEVGLRRAHECPSLMQPLAELINTFLDNEPDENSDTFELLSAVFSCVYGQMSRHRILATWPPFARRQAALAHASLVGRYFIKADENRAEFIRWLRGINQEYSIMQTLLDMRTEPRWHFEFNSAQQWRNELWGRIWQAANVFPDAVTAMGLTERFAGDAPQAVVHRIDRAAAFRSGPLEGGVAAATELSPEIVTQIDERLRTKIDTVAFTGLINASAWFRIPDELVEQAADALESHHYQIPLAEECSLFSCILGLASVAAVSRSARLCSAIHTALRVSRHLDPGRLTIGSTFHAGMIACAAHCELADWTDCVGQFMTDLSLQDLAKEEAQALNSYLSIMCHLVPELWRTCGQAQAAFSLVAGK